jgi:hypothetical protein
MAPLTGTANALRPFRDPHHMIEAIAIAACGISIVFANIQRYVQIS